ncbi:MAG: hypothetical protein H7Y06_00170 [Opitutaceae bacterium]|nr:hypothetical protein [Opitutaceae bacterium]
MIPSTSLPAQNLAPSRPWRLVLALLAGLPCAFAEQVVYRATFSNDSGANQPLSPYGWSIVTGGGAVGQVAVIPETSRRVPDEVAAETPFGIGQSAGVLFIDVPQIPRTVIISAPLTPAPVSNLATISWDWSAGNSVAHLARPAVKISGVWYVPHRPAWTTFNTRDFLNKGTKTTFAFTSLAASDWKALNSPLGTADTETLPSAKKDLSGTVDAFGLWFRIGGSPGALRIDNVEITTKTPAPRT